MNELSIVIFMMVAGGLWSLMAYSVGYKEGERVGYGRGRAINRHIAATSKAVK